MGYRVDCPRCHRSGRVYQTGVGETTCGYCGGSGFVDSGSSSDSSSSSSYSSSDYSSSPSGHNPADDEYRSSYLAFNEAVRFEKQGKYEEALSAFTRAINPQSGDNSITMARRGQLYFNLQRYEEAANDFVSVLTGYYGALNQESLNAVFNMLEESLNQIGDDNKKNEAYKKIVDRNINTSTGKYGDARALNWAKGMLKGNNSSSSSNTTISVNKLAAFFSTIACAVALGILPGFDLIRLGIGAVVGLLLGIFVNRKNKEEGFCYYHSDGLFVASLIVNILFTLFGGYLAFFVGSGFGIFLWSAFCLTMLIIFKAKSVNFTIRGEGLANLACLLLVIIGSGYLFFSSPSTGITFERYSDVIQEIDTEE